MELDPVAETAAHTKRNGGGGGGKGGGGSGGAGGGAGGGISWLLHEVEAAAQTQPFLQTLCYDWQRSTVYKQN